MRMSGKLEGVRERWIIWKGVEICKLCTPRLIYQTSAHCVGKTIYFRWQGVQESKRTAETACPLENST